MSGDHNMNQTDSAWRKRQIALDKKAENARELGLDYEPDAVMQSLKDLKRSVCDAVGEKAFAQPEQEPWCMRMNGCKTKCEDCPVEVAQPEHDTVQRLSALIRAQQITIDKLEAQRTWVGLTDDEVINVFKEKDAMKFARAIEAKLKEKNT